MHLKSFCLDVGNIEDGNAALFWKRDGKIGVIFDSHWLASQLNIRSREEEGAGRGGIFICSKLRQNLSEIQDKTLERIQKVIWGHLLAFKGEIIQKQALFSLPFRTPNNSGVVLIRCLSCFFFRSLFYLAEVIFSSKSRKESLELMFSFKV